MSIIDWPEGCQSSRKDGSMLISWSITTSSPKRPTTENSCFLIDADCNSRKNSLTRVCGLADETRFERIDSKEY
jgi:hypothetical protein